MLICIFGESCAGKTTLAQRLLPYCKATLYHGKDYLRLAKNEAEAKQKFRTLLENAAEGGNNIIFVTTEKENLSLLPEHCVRILVTAPLSVIQERFAKRMGGTLPPPVAAMLERKLGCFDHEPHDLLVKNGQEDLDAILRLLRR